MVQDRHQEKAALGPTHKAMVNAVVNVFKSIGIRFDSQFVVRRNYLVVLFSKGGDLRNLLPRFVDAAKKAGVQMPKVEFNAKVGDAKYWRLDFVNQVEGNPRGFPHAISVDEHNGTFYLYM